MSNHDDNMLFSWSVETPFSAIDKAELEDYIEQYPLKPLQGPARIKVEPRIEHLIDMGGGDNHLYYRLQISISGSVPLATVSGILHITLECSIQDSQISVRLTEEEWKKPPVLEGGGLYLPVRWVANRMMHSVLPEIQQKLERSLNKALSEELDRQHRRLIEYFPPLENGTPQLSIFTTPEIIRIQCLWNRSGDSGQHHVRMEQPGFQMKFHKDLFEHFLQEQTLHIPLLGELNVHRAQLQVERETLSGEVHFTNTGDQSVAFRLHPRWTGDQWSFESLRIEEINARALPGGKISNRLLLKAIVIPVRKKVDREINCAWEAEAAPFLQRLLRDIPVDRWIKEEISFRLCPPDHISLHCSMDIPRGEIAIPNFKGR